MTPLASHAWFTDLRASIIGLTTAAIAIKLPEAYLNATAKSGLSSEARAKALKRGRDASLQSSLRSAISQSIGDTLSTFAAAADSSIDLASYMPRHCEMEVEDLIIDTSTFPTVKVTLPILEVVHSATECSSTCSIPCPLAEEQKEYGTVELDLVLHATASDTDVGWTVTLGPETEMKFN